MHLPAPFWARVVHGGVDSLLGLAVGPAVLMASLQAIGIDTQQLSLPTVVNVAIMVVSLFCFRYFLYLLAERSFGNMLTQHRLVSFDGQKPTKAQLRTRAWSVLLPWNIFTYRDGLFGHDRASQTRLVKVPRPRTKSHEEMGFWEAQLRSM